MSTRSQEWASEGVMSKSAASRHWIEATVAKIPELRERDLRTASFFGLMLDGVFLGDTAMSGSNCRGGRLDTNAIENAIRPSKLGAKNWLFIGHPAAGDRAAVLYSLIVSVQRRGLDPHACLKDVLTRLPTMTNHDDLTPLLPAHGRAVP